MENLDAESIATIIKGGVTTLSVALGSKPAAIFVEKVSGMLGWAIEPTTIKRKARAEAAASIIKAEAEQEIKSLEQRSAARMIYEEARFQQNIEAIVLKALSNIKDDAKPNEVDDDWFTNYLEKCRRISNAEMQNLWAQILAGEINEPGSFSPITLNTLSLLTKDDAVLFKKLCSYVWLGEGGTPTIMLPYDVLMDKEVFNLTGNNVYHFGDIGLATYEPDGLTHSGSDVSYAYHDRGYSIKMRGTTDENALVTQFPVGNMNLTQAGREIYLICSPEPNWDYMTKVVEYWRSRGFGVVSLMND